MRIGVDVRGLQSGTSAHRGIGRYVLELLDEQEAFYPGDELILFTLAGRELPNRWGERFQVVPVEGLVEKERTVPWDTESSWPWPWYLKIPKVRKSQALRDYYGMRIIAHLRANFERAVNGEKLDVLHLPTAIDLTSYPEGRYDPPTVATFYDAIPVVHPEIYYDLWPPFEQRRYDGQMANLRTFDHVVAISEASRDDAIRFAKVDSGKVSVVYPSISDAYGTPVDLEPVRTRYGLPGPFALFCSVPDVHKNFARVIEAFAHAKASMTPGTRLAFISPLEEPFQSRVRDVGREHGLRDENLVITGRIPEEDVVALFQAADCLVSPSLLEGFGLPAAQALAAGTPAIVSARGSQPEVVGDAGMVVDPEDVRAIADAIRRLMTDAALREDFAVRGRERAKLFRPENQAKGMHAIYEKVAR